MSYSCPCCCCYNCCGYNPCPQPCPQPCPPTPPSCPAVVYITNIDTATAVPSGGMDIPVGTVIATGTTTVPANTVTVINGYTGAPSTNLGGVTANNGFFTVPMAGRYVVATNICFASVDTTTTSDMREVYIYRVQATTGVVTQIAADSRTPIASSTTCVNVSSVTDLAAGDRLFVAARQINADAAVINTVASVGRLAITRVC